MAQALPIHTTVTPDADLLSAAADFIALERRASAARELHDTVPPTPGAGTALDAILEQQEALVDRLTGTPATTLAGVRAKALSLGAWRGVPLDTDDWTERLTTTLVADLGALQL